MFLEVYHLFSKLCGCHVWDWDVSIMYIIYLLDSDSSDDEMSDDSGKYILPADDYEIKEKFEMVRNTHTCCYDE